jgi:hypothetical protein
MTDWITEHDGSRWLSEDAAKEVIEALEDAVTELSITRTNVMIELGRGQKQWDGVPELLKLRSDRYRALLARINTTQTPAPGVVRKNGEE